MPGFTATPRPRLFRIRRPTGVWLVALKRPLERRRERLVRLEPASRRHLESDMDGSPSSQRVGRRLGLICGHVQSVARRRASLERRRVALADLPAEGERDEEAEEKREQAERAADRTEHAHLGEVRARVSVSARARARVSGR